MCDQLDAMRNVRDAAEALQCACRNRIERGVGHVLKRAFRPRPLSLEFEMLAERFKA